MDEGLRQGLLTAIGMSIAYVASGLGMLFAWRGYRKQQRLSAQRNDDRGEVQ
ncbi:MAG: hypothetical protein ABGZ35_06380 [Planctomycetaceae bacterium]